MLLAPTLCWLLAPSLFHAAFALAPHVVSPLASSTAVTADVTHDGRYDIVAVVGNTLQVFPNTGAPGAAAFNATRPGIPVSSDASLSDPIALTTADFDGVNGPDIIAVFASPRCTLAWIPNPGPSQSFAASTTVVLPTSVATGWPLTCGRVALAASAAAAAAPVAVAVTFEDPARLFLFPDRFTAADPFYDTSPCTTAPLVAPSVAFGRLTSPTFFDVIVNGCLFAVSTPPTATTPHLEPGVVLAALPKPVDAVSVTDVDGDGDDDLVYASSSGTTPHVSWVENGDVTIGVDCAGAPHVGCPCGWNLYDDAVFGNVEGESSCWKDFGPHVSFATANTTCTGAAPNSHVITSASISKDNDIFRHVEANSSRFWVGATQDAVCSTPDLTGWRWVDGTRVANLISSPFSASGLWESQPQTAPYTMWDVANHGLVDAVDAPASAVCEMPVEKRVTLQTPDFDADGHEEVVLAGPHLSWSETSRPSRASTTLVHRCVGGPTADDAACGQLTTTSCCATLGAAFTSLASVPGATTLISVHGTVELPVVSSWPPLTRSLVIEGATPDAALACPPNVDHPIVLFGDGGSLLLEALTFTGCSGRFLSADGANVALHNVTIEDTATTTPADALIHVSNTTLSLTRVLFAMPSSGVGSLYAAVHASAAARVTVSDFTAALPAGALSVFTAEDSHLSLLDTRMTCGAATLTHALVRLLTSDRYQDRHTALDMERASFTGCHTAGDGGAVDVQFGDVTMSSCVFDDCHAAGRGGAVFAPGSRLMVTRTSFQDCTADGFGGGLFADFADRVFLSEASFSSCGARRGGAVAAQYVDAMEVTNSILFDNTAVEDGGALFSVATALHLTTVTLTGNTAGRNGGGLAATESDVSVNGSTLSDNSALGNGGSVATSQGGTLTLDSSTLTLGSAGGQQCGTTGAGVGGAIHTLEPSSFRVINSTFSDHEACAGGTLGVTSSSTTQTLSFTGTAIQGSQSAGTGGSVLWDASNGGTDMHVTDCVIEASTAPSTTIGRSLFLVSRPTTPVAVVATNTDVNVSTTAHQVVPLYPLPNATITLEHFQALQWVLLDASGSPTAAAVCQITSPAGVPLSGNVVNLHGAATAPFTFPALAMNAYANETADPTSSRLTFPLDVECSVEYGGSTPYSVAHVGVVVEQPRCRPGTQPTEDLTACVACLPGSTSCVCPAGSYRPAALVATDTSGCRECPTGTDCGEVGLTAATFTVLSGYWRFGYASEEVRQCRMDGACNASRPLTPADADLTAGGYCDTEDGGPLCSRHHCGALCELCVEGYFLDVTECRPCSEGPSYVTPTGLGWGAIVFLVVFGSLYLVAVCKQKSPVTGKIPEDITPNFKGASVPIRVMMAAKAALRWKSCCPRHFKRRHHKAKPAAKKPKASLPPKRGSGRDIARTLTIPTHALAEHTPPVSARRPGLPPRPTPRPAPHPAPNTNANTATPRTRTETPRTQATTRSQLTTLTQLTNASHPNAMPMLWITRVKIALSFLQLLNTFGTQYGLDLDAVAAVGEWFSFVNVTLFSFVNVPCSWRGLDQLDRLVIVTVSGGGILLGLLLWLWLLHGGVVCTSRASSYKPRVLLVVLLLAFLMFAAVANDIVTTLRCIRFDNGRQFLSADVRIDCDSDRYHAHAAYAWVMLFVFPIGIPTGYFVLLWWHRHSLYPANRDLVMTVWGAGDMTYLIVAGVEFMSAAGRLDLQRRVKLTACRMQVMREPLPSRTRACWSYLKTCLCAPEEEPPSPRGTPPVVLEKPGFPAGFDGIPDTDVNGAASAVSLTSLGLASAFHFAFPTRNKKERKLVHKLADDWHLTHYNMHADLLTRANKPELEGFRFLFEDYEPKFWYQEVVEMLKKFLLTTLLLLPSTFQESQFGVLDPVVIVVAILVVLAAGCWYIKTQPWLNYHDDNTSVAAAGVLFLVLFYGLLRKLDSDAETATTERVSLVLACMAIIIPILGLTSALYTFWSIRWEAFMLSTPEIDMDLVDALPVVVKTKLLFGFAMPAAWMRYVVSNQNVRHGGNPPPPASGGVPPPPPPPTRRSPVGVAGGTGLRRSPQGPPRAIVRSPATASFRLTPSGSVRRLPSEPFGVRRVRSSMGCVLPVLKPSGATRFLSTGSISTPRVLSPAALSDRSGSRWPQSAHSRWPSSGHNRWPSLSSDMPPGGHGRWPSMATDTTERHSSNPATPTEHDGVHPGLPLSPRRSPHMQTMAVVEEAAEEAQPSPTATLANADNAQSSPPIVVHENPIASEEVLVEPPSDTSRPSSVVDDAHSLAGSELEGLEDSTPAERVTAAVAYIVSMRNLLATPAGDGTGEPEPSPNAAATDGDVFVVNLPDSPGHLGDPSNNV